MLPAELIYEKVPQMKSDKSRSKPEQIIVDFTRPEGAIKPLHGINNTPVVYNGKIPELLDACIPYVRLHDTGGAFGGTYLVDVPNLFPDFEADPKDPASYDFAYNDAYFRTLVASGMKIFYRLGVTIENNYQLKPQRIFPPRDFRKWADICSGIIRHYTEGWADGFHYDIQYWEIWNEPESPAMWQGTYQQFYEMYTTVAPILKKRFPKLKIGGYGGSGFFAITRQNCNELRKDYLRFFQEFLTHLKSHPEAPFDFFTWHLYSKDPHEAETHALYVRRQLDEAGFTHTESIFGEWNYIEHDTCAEDRAPWDTMRSSEGAAYVAAIFALFQKAPVDMCLYYDAFPQRKYCGLYLYPEHKVSRTYYSFKAFNYLYQLGTAVHAEAGEAENGIYALAATDGQGQGAMLLANRRPVTRRLQLQVIGLNGAPAILVIDDDRALTEVNWLLEDGTLTVPPCSVLLLKW